MDEKRIMIRDRDFSTLTRATTTINANNISFRKTIDGLVCESCHRSYSPHEGYFSTEAGTTMYDTIPCSNEDCGTEPFYMVLTADGNGEKARKCPNCGFVLNQCDPSSASGNERRA